LDIIEGNILNVLPSVVSSVLS